MAGRSREEEGRERGSSSWVLGWLDVPSVARKSGVRSSWLTVCFLVVSLLSDWTDLLVRRIRLHLLLDHALQPILVILVVPLVLVLQHILGVLQLRFRQCSVLVVLMTSLLLVEVLFDGWDLVMRIISIAQRQERCRQSVVSGNLARRRAYA